MRRRCPHGFASSDGLLVCAVLRRPLRAGRTDPDRNARERCTSPDERRTLRKQQIEEMHVHR